MNMTANQWVQLWWLRLMDSAAAYGYSITDQDRYDAMMEVCRLENLCAKED